MKSKQHSVNDLDSAVGADDVAIYELGVVDKYPPFLGPYLQLGPELGVQVNKRQGGTQLRSLDDVLLKDLRDCVLVVEQLIESGPGNEIEGVVRGGEDRVGPGVDVVQRLGELGNFQSLDESPESSVLLQHLEDGPGGYWVDDVVEEVNHAIGSTLVNLVEIELNPVHRHHPVVVLVEPYSTIFEKGLSFKVVLDDAEENFAVGDDVVLEDRLEQVEVVGQGPDGAVVQLGEGVVGRSEDREGSSVFHLVQEPGLLDQAQNGSGFFVFEDADQVGRREVVSRGGGPGTGSASATALSFIVLGVFRGGGWRTRMLGRVLIVRLLRVK